MKPEELFGGAGQVLWLRGRRAMACIATRSCHCFLLELWRRRELARCATCECGDDPSSSSFAIARIGRARSASSMMMMMMMIMMMMIMMTVASWWFWARIGRFSSRRFRSPMWPSSPSQRCMSYGSLSGILWLLWLPCTGRLCIGQRMPPVWWPQGRD